MTDPYDGQPVDPHVGQPVDPHVGQPGYGAPAWPIYPPPAPPPPPPPLPEPPRSRRNLVIAGVVAAVLAVAGVGAYALTRDANPAAKAGVGFGTTSEPVPSGFPTLPSSGESAPGGSLPGGPGLPTAPGAGIALCETAASGFDAATVYVGAALTGIGEFAQSCVYKNSVPVSITNSLRGKLYAPITTDRTATVVRFASIDGTSRITVHTKKEPDGFWYVVGVTTG